MSRQNVQQRKNGNSLQNMCFGTVLETVFLYSSLDASPVEITSIVATARLLRSCLPPLFKASSRKIAQINFDILVHQPSAMPMFGSQMVMDIFPDRFSVLPAVDLFFYFLVSFFPFFC